MQRFAGCPAGQACVQLSSLAPDFASAVRQLSNAVLHFESVSALHVTMPGDETALNTSKAWHCSNLHKPNNAVPISCFHP